MQVSKIYLKNFRNYQEQSINLASGTNVFIGQNGQGKTNILEAIYLCACARSHRTGRDLDLIKDQADFYQVEIEFESDSRADRSIKIVYQTKPRQVREIYYCGLKQAKISDFFGLFHAVIFAPEDLMLIKEGPAIRRRFLDLLISQIKPLYFKNLQSYQFFLKQRNQLLKNIKEMQQSLRQDKKDTLTSQKENYDFNLLQLTIWTEKLAEVLAQIIKVRQAYIDKIESIAKSSLLTISDGQENLQINYKTVSGIDPYAEEEEIYQALLKRYERQLDDDIFRGNTASGSHRDDLDLVIDGGLLKDRGSQGQQRSAVLALKLAELKIIEDETGEKPVLLLDDVMSELDPKRRARLLSSFESNQVFITCTDLNQIYPTFKGQLVEKSSLKDTLEEMGDSSAKEVEGQNPVSNADQEKRIGGKKTLHFAYDPATKEDPSKASQKAQERPSISFFKVKEATVKEQILL